MLYRTGSSKADVEGGAKSRDHRQRKQEQETGGVSREGSRRRCRPQHIHRGLPREQFKGESRRTSSITSSEEGDDDRWPRQEGKGMKEQSGQGPTGGEGQAHVGLYEVPESRN